MARALKGGASVAPIPASGSGANSRRAMLRALNGAGHYAGAWIDLAKPSRAEIDAALVEVRAVMDALTARLLAAQERAS